MESLCYFFELFLSRSVCAALSGFAVSASSPCWPCRIWGRTRLWLNGLYDAVCIIVLFPLVVAAGAGGKVTDRVSKKVCGFLGDISYPLYITHYPFVYIYTAWVIDTRPAWPEALGYGALVYGGSILLAWLCLRLYDEPVRGWLKRRFMQRKPVQG